MADPLADIWIWFADTSCRNYSPLYDRISRTVASSDEVLTLVREAPPRAHQPNVLLAAVHYQLLGGYDHPLAAVYAGESDADPGPLFVDVCLRRRAEILALMETRHTNTNEVGRCAVIAPALTTVAAELGAPLGLIDVGCSAGLNLLCDRYFLDYGAAGSTGPADARVRITSRVVAGAPPIASEVPALASRVGIDRDPVDATDPDAVRWQLACVFPDTGRLPRTRLAFDLARDLQPPIVCGDAVEKVTEVIAAVPANATPVVVTTWAAAYFSIEARVAFRDALAAASRDRPVAWVSGEGAGVVDLFDVTPLVDEQGMEASVLGLATFRGGTVHARVLGFVHPHGNWLAWEPS